MSSQFKQSAAALPRHAKTNAQTSGLLPSSPQSPNGSLETVTTSSDVYDFADEAFWSEVIEGEEATDANRKPLAGAALLASRFYELERRPTGEIVAARMPARESHQRFGPSTEEIKALLALGSLEQLDLGDTIASSAVPIANRHANLRVLVLSDQTDTASLGRLSGIQELRLINSDVDRMALADRGIRVVYLDR